MHWQALSTHTAKWISILRLSRHVFVREFLSDFYERRFVSGLISEDEFYRYQAVLVSDELGRFARELFARSPSLVEIPGCGAIRLIRLREMDGKEFPFLLALPPKATLPRRKVTCFVGHRFLKRIEEPLRFNLKHVLSPYGIELKWSAKDLTASDMFRDIVAGIREANMCFFDCLGTANKPNVYISRWVSLTRSACRLC